MHRRALTRHARSRNWMMRTPVLALIFVRATLFASSRELKSVAISRREVHDQTAPGTSGRQT
jgi:hypothetical protein